MVQDLFYFRRMEERWCSASEKNCLDWFLEPFVFSTQMDFLFQCGKKSADQRVVVFARFCRSNWIEIAIDAFMLAEGNMYVNGSHAVWDVSYQLSAFSNQLSVISIEEAVMSKENSLIVCILSSVICLSAYNSILATLSKYEPLRWNHRHSSECTLRNHSYLTLSFL